MFREVLARAACDLPGCRGAAVIGIDGMVIEQWTAQGESRMEPLAAEVTSVIKAARSACLNTDGEGLTEVTLRTSGWAGVVRSIGSGYFLILLTAPDSLLGRARFVAERAAPLIERELV